MIISPANRISEVKEYYFSVKLAEIAKLRASGKDIINLGIGSPDLSPSEETIDALCISAKNPGNHAYQSYTGISELRREIARWYYRNFEVSLNSESEILPLMGSKEGIMHISMAFLNKGDEVLVPNPGYPTYSSVSNLVEAEIRYYNLTKENDWLVDIESLKKQDLSNVKLMWINYPHMPTGATCSKEHFSELIKLAKENEFLIVNDNPYSLILNNSPLSILDGQDWNYVLELNSMSKSHNMAGWRLGWISGKEEYIKTILRVKSNMDSGMFLPIQHAAIRALNNDEKWHRDLNLRYSQRRNFVWKIMDIIGCEYDRNSVGMFVWGKLPDEVADPKQFVDDILYKADVFITPGLIFGSNGDRYIRISLCCKQETLKEAYRRIKKYYGI